MTRKKIHVYAYIHETGYVFLHYFILNVLQVKENVMKIMFNSALYGGYTPQKTQKVQNSTVLGKMPTLAQSGGDVAFKGWFPDFGYYFAKRLNNKRENEKEEQFRKVRKNMYDDVSMMAERMDISLEEARERFEDDMNLASIPLKRDGKEVGLNKVVGYSVEKYIALKELIIPLMAAKINSNTFVPNGVLLYGAMNIGKTHFARALGEHIKIKELADFKEIKINSADASDPQYKQEILRIFNNAEKRYLETGKRQILFFDNIDLLFDEDFPQAGYVFMALISKCSKKGITWIGTSNFPEALPEPIYKPFRLNVDIPFQKMSNAEKMAVMSYFWTKYDRLDETSHETLLKKYKHSGFNFFPPEVDKVADNADTYLALHEDRNSYLSNKITVRKPVTTKIMDKQIHSYIYGSTEEGTKKVATKQDMLDVNAPNYRDYVKGRRAKYEDSKPVQ